MFGTNDTFNTPVCSLFQLLIVFLFVVFSGREMFSNKSSGEPCQNNSL